MAGRRSIASESLASKYPMIATSKQLKARPGPGADSARELLPARAGSRPRQTSTRLGGGGESESRVSDDWAGAGKGPVPAAVCRLIHSGFLHTVPWVLVEEALSRAPLVRCPPDSEVSEQAESGRASPPAPDGGASESVRLPGLLPRQGARAAAPGGRVLPRRASPGENRVVPRLPRPQPPALDLDAAVRPRRRPHPGPGGTRLDAELFLPDRVRVPAVRDMN
jgi:hypothetical protein